MRPTNSIHRQQLLSFSADDCAKTAKNCSSCKEMRDRKLRDTTPRVRCTESHSLHRQQSNDDLHSFSWLILLAAAAGGRLMVSQDFGPWLQWTAQSAEKMYEVHRSKFSFSLEIIFDIFIVFFFNLLKRSFSDGFREPTAVFYKLFTMWQLQKKNCCGCIGAAAAVLYVRMSRAVLLLQKNCNTLRNVEILNC